VAFETTRREALGSMAVVPGGRASLARSNLANCPLNYHYSVDRAPTLANLAYRLGRSVRCDAKTEKIVEDKQAAKLARPVYRRPWKSPAEYL
jgi:hypothetical protein